MNVPETRYARSGDVSIAYQVVGDGPFDLVWTPGALTHLDLSNQLILAGEVRPPVPGRRPDEQGRRRGNVVVDNAIGDEGALELAASPHLAGLSLLDVRGNPINERGEAALQARFGDRVKHGDPREIEGIIDH